MKDYYINGVSSTYFKPSFNKIDKQKIKVRVYLYLFSTITYSLGILAYISHIQNLFNLLGELFKRLLRLSFFFDCTMNMVHVLISNYFSLAKIPWQNNFSERYNNRISICLGRTWCQP